jgi:UDP-glucose 4-epimerase
MKVLVSGAGGFLGRHTVARLLGNGHSVRAIIRPQSAAPAWSGHVDMFRADLRAHQNLTGAFTDIDVVLHLASATSGGEDAQFLSTVIGTERLLDAMSKSSTRRLILVSSLVVYDWTHAKGVLDENTPLLKKPYGMGAYTIAKAWQERVVSKYAAAYSWDLTILRPGFIWGPEHARIAGMGRHVGRFYVMFGPLTRLPLTHVLNCADCIVKILDSPNVAGETFNVVDNDDIRVWRYVREYVKRADPSGVLIPLPYAFGLGLARLASLTSRLLFGERGRLPSLLTSSRFEAQFKPIRFSNKKLRQKVNWKPPLHFDDCLRATYE